MSAANANVTTHFTVRQQVFHGTAAIEGLDTSRLKYYCTLEGYYCKISYFCWLNRTSTIEKSFRYQSILVKDIFMLFIKIPWTDIRHKSVSWRLPQTEAFLMKGQLWIIYFLSHKNLISGRKLSVMCDVWTRSVTTGAQSWPGTGGGNMSSLLTLLTLVTLVTLVTRVVTQRPPRRGCEVDGISMCGYESHEQMVDRLMALQQSFPGLARVSASCARRYTALKFLLQICQRLFSGFCNHWRWHFINSFIKTETLGVVCL